MNAIWFINGVYLGDSFVVDNFAGDQVHYCCSTCGKEWAQVLCIDDNWWSHTFVERKCLSCGGSGKLYLPYHGITDESMPSLILELELLAAQRNPKDYRDCYNVD